MLLNKVCHLNSLHDVVMKYAKIIPLLTQKLILTHSQTAN